MSGPSTSWVRLPPEIRFKVLSILPDLGGICSLLATVSREWRSVIEPLNFAEISLTLPRLANPESENILFRNRKQIHYIWFCVELKEYDCQLCTPKDLSTFGLYDDDNKLITEAFRKLFLTLSRWERRGNLVLDISVFSPSDTEHWFKYLSFQPDAYLDRSTSLNRDKPENGIIPDDPIHGWFRGKQRVAPEERTIDKVFDEIMSEGPFEDEESEMEWWRTQPLVPAVTRVLLRRQTRRRWKPVALANILTRFPNLEGICYEPWREWWGMQRQTDKRTQTLIEMLAKMKLSNLTIFENDNEAYPDQYFECSPTRVMSPALSQRLALTSLELVTLSASFLVDASYFFEATEKSWKWESLEKLALTSSILDSNSPGRDINDMLQAAATAALRMSKLQTLELWNGKRGTAMLFRYQKAQNEQPAIITIRGTFELSVESTVIQAWDAVAHQDHHAKVVIQRSLIGKDDIRSHADAICQLGLSTQVIRPVSLQQILDEHRLRAWPVIESRLLTRLYNQRQQALAEAANLHDIAAYFREV